MRSQAAHTASAASLLRVTISLFFSHKHACAKHKTLMVTLPGYNLSLFFSHKHKRAKKKGLISRASPSYGHLSPEKVTINGPYAPSVSYAQHSKAYCSRSLLLKSEILKAYYSSSLGGQFMVT